MIEGILSLCNLRWTQTPQYHPLPPNIKRITISTPAGDLELLASEPTAEQQTGGHAPPPVLFVHGGFGHAAVWLPWMSNLSSNYPGRTYAISLRGHGASWAPTFLRMWLFTTLADLSEDLVAAVGLIERREGLRKPVLVGHSAGGGLIQYALSKGLVQTPAMGLAAAIPCFGSMPVYMNWARLDPWLMVRSLFHFQHPRSPLSSDGLVRRVFFGHRFPMAEVKEFSNWMPKYESMAWAMSMMRSGFAKCQDVLKGVVGSGESRAAGERVLVMAGGEDKIMPRALMERMAAEYRDVIAARERERQPGFISGVVLRRRDQPRVDSGKVIEEERVSGVRLIVIADSGHHLQNDVHANEAAEALRGFLEQL